MNDGWESPDETSAPPARQQQQHSHYSNSSRGGYAGGGGGGGYQQRRPPGDRNWRTRDDNKPSDSYNKPNDSTWGEVDTDRDRPRYGGGGGRGGGRGRGGGDGGFGGQTRVFNNRQRNYDGSAANMEVPPGMVGRIIGRGGSKISDLQRTSGARIVVTKEESDEGMIIVKLFGEQGAIDEAKTMIEELVEQKPPMRNNLGNNAAEDNGHYVRQPVSSMKINWKELSEECDRLTQERWSKCPPMIKAFYVEDPEVSAMTEDDVRQFRRENNNIVVSRVFAEEEYEAGKTLRLPADMKPAPKPVRTFEQAFRPWPELLVELQRAGFTKPSPIQAQAWPALLAGEDVIGIAQTGTGKTLAFLLPALVHIHHQPVPRDQRGGANVLVLAPTRELALQIEREVAKYKYQGISAVCVYGGGNRKEQVNTVCAGVEIIIATPGRLNDLVAAGHVDVTAVTYLVLDEADRMLDMGFEPQIRKVLLDIRPDRQTVMTSATWPAGVRRLAHSYMRDPLQVYVGSLDLVAVHSVAQRVVIIGDNDEEEKFGFLMNWIHQMESTDKVIVFCGKKARADHISAELSAAGLECVALHGDREQADREAAVRDISSGAVQILVATDVASRGLDINDLTHVLNYDFPRHIEEYVHRVGRTGRAGKSGQAISLVSRYDWAQAEELVRILEESEQYVPQPLRDMALRHSAFKERKENERLGGRGRGQFRHRD